MTSHAHLYMITANEDHLSQIIKKLISIEKKICDKLKSQLCFENKRFSLEFYLRYL